MKKGVSKNPKISSAYGRRSALSDFQRSVEHHAASLRAELNLFDLDVLHQDEAFARLPNCNVTAIKNVPNLPYEIINHFRLKANHLGAFAVRDSDGNIEIVFNDAHPIETVRVNLMEEYFHLRLGHPPDKIRPYEYPHRTYDQCKEDEAFGCGAAALVPYGGLETMLANGDHVARIAEHFRVLPDVVTFRIGMTRLGHLTLPQARQISLLATTRLQQAAPGFGT